MDPEMTPVGAGDEAPKRRGRKPRGTAGDGTEPPPKPAKSAKPAKDAGPTELLMDLYAPGMSVLHRAGLGGLACTLKWIERAAKRGLLSDDDLPGGPWADGKPPWTMDARTVTLRWGEPTAAREYLRRLFALSFQVRDGLIYLPGQYGEVDPTMAVRADLQLGITLTFLQHGGTRKLDKVPLVAQHDPDGSGVPGVTVEYKACSGFKHQSGWEELVDTKGRLRAEPVTIDGPISPGAAVRHQAFSTDTKADDTADKLVPLYFAMVGCQSQAVNRGVGVLLIPEVEDLTAFVGVRPELTPRTAKDGFVAGPADGALRAQVRMRNAIRARNLREVLDIPGCHATQFMPTAWASQQKSRVNTVALAGGDARKLERFEIALSMLPPGIVTKTKEEFTGKGRKKVVTRTWQESWRTDSVVRPLVADNLALDRPWYSGFARLMTARDPVNNEPLRNKVSFERKGLHAMTRKTELFDDPDEALIVQSVHEAIRSNRARIREDTDGAKPLSQATKNRWEKFQERLRIDLAGAKTVDQVRFALCNLFSRSEWNPTLRNQWRKVLPVLSHDWKLVRDLGLLALASYGSSKAKPDGGEAGSPDESPDADAETGGS